MTQEELDYSRAVRAMMATAEDGDTTCTVDGMNWHCIWCGEPTGEGTTCCEGPKTEGAPDVNLHGLPDVDDWRFEYMYPGTPSWNSGAITVCAGPDWDGSLGEICVHDGLAADSAGSIMRFRQRLDSLAQRRGARK